MSIQSQIASTPIAGIALVVEPIEGVRDRLRFIHLPWQVYAGNVCWVPPLLLARRRFFGPTRNPFFLYAVVLALLGSG